ncbi:uncharacterized protein LOC134206535 [Armigeres subalbatus]|uniref:uncharacterized protein LOC134206535 n=1 Tax=Armigeres subalbatus TaxID=124917 RepID=UPI002ED10B24
MSSLTYNIAPFCEHGPGSTNSRWEEWRDQFVAYLDLKKVHDCDEKHKALLCFGGPDIRKIAKDVVVSDNLMDNQYRATMEALDNYYSPRMSLRYERLKFRQMTFSPNERLDQFVVRLKTQAAMCSFGDEVDSMVMDQIVYATQNDDKLRAKYLECDTTLDEMLKIGRTYETVNQQVHEIRFKSPDNIEVNAILNADNVHRTKKLSCVRCSGNHTSVDPLCPARGSRCGVDLRLIIDTGADEDVLGIDDWTTLKRVGFEAYDIRKGSDKIFQAYGSNKPLIVLGEVDAMIAVGEQSCRTTFFVIQDGKHSLLSGQTAERLGVVKFLRSLGNETFPSIKGMCASIKIDKSIPPVRQGYRRIPIPLEEITILKLKELMSQDVIERVNEACEWVSPCSLNAKVQTRNVTIKVPSNSEFVFVND